MYRRPLSPAVFIIDITRPDILRAKITGQRTEYNRRICGPRGGKGSRRRDVYISARSRSSRYLRPDTLLKRGDFWPTSELWIQYRGARSSFTYFLKSKRFDNFSILLRKCSILDRRMKFMSLDLDNRGDR